VISDWDLALAAWWPLASRGRRIYMLIHAYIHTHIHTYIHTYIEVPKIQFQLRSQQSFRTAVRTELPNPAWYNLMTYAFALFAPVMPDFKNNLTKKAA